MNVALMQDPLRLDLRTLRTETPASLAFGIPSLSWPLLDASECKLRHSCGSITMASLTRDLRNLQVAL